VGLIRYLLDSVILIDHLNQIQAATNYIYQNHDYCAISVVTRAEVLVPYQGKGALAILRLLNSFPSLAIDAEVADAAAVLRRTFKWKLPDAFQAALAEKHALKLITRNTKDFPAEKLKWVETPY
jgi:predicted nucleic acid-binding protein